MGGVADGALCGTTPRELVAVVWIALSIAGLLVETTVIVVLGRMVTGPYEDEHATHLGPPVSVGAREGRRARP
ncbi:hypothetical protein ACI797_07430 [Geodermatophilus sp. SYSU D00691]